MTQIARIVAGFPAIPPALADAARRVANPHPEAGAPAIPADVVAAATAMLPRVEAATAPATADEWLRWLRPLAILPAGPKTREEFLAAVGPITFALTDIPAAVLTENTQRAALREFTFWPKPAELHRLLSPSAAPMLAQANALRRLAAARIAEAPRPPERTESERAHVAAAVASLRHEQPARQAAPARPVDPAHLLAALEAQIAAGKANPAAIARAESLRQRCRA